MRNLSEIWSGYRTDEVITKEPVQGTFRKFGVLLIYVLACFRSLLELIQWWENAAIPYR